jgi:hypothetical protein
MRSPDGKKYEHVVGPSPRTRGGGRAVGAHRVDLVAVELASSDWKMRREPSADQYASAFCPPNVSCLTFGEEASPPPG